MYPSPRGGAGGQGALPNIAVHNRWLTRVTGRIWVWVEIDFARWEAAGGCGRVHTIWNMLMLVWAQQLDTVGAGMVRQLL